jgi:hypothetical protein
MVGRVFYFEDPIIERIKNKQRQYKHQFSRCCDNIRTSGIKSL